MTSGQTLLDQASSRILNDATSQADRAAGAPAPERLLVDGRSLAQIVAFAARYGALVNFYDLHDSVSGDWAPFFASDRSVILATHAALDLSGIERDLKRQLAKARRNPALLGRVITVLARLIAIHDRDPGDPGNAEDYLRHPGVLARNDAMTDPLRRLHGHLGNETLERALARRGPAGDVRWNDHLFEILDDISITLIGALRHGYDQALIMLQASLHEEGHAPQAALWNTFAKLFSDARAEINGFPRRLVDYYYGEVLQQNAVDAVPDELYLTFTSAQAADQASVPRAACFSAGTDGAGLAIQYTARNTLEVTPAKVVNLSVHRVLNRQLVTDAAGHVVKAPPTVLTGEVALDPAAPDAIEPFAMFGNGRDQNGSIPLQKASLGFTISSPVLMLTGGNRQIDIGLVITAQPQANGAPTTGASTPPGAPGFAGEDTALLNRATLAAQLIQQTFVLHYTTAGGWIKVEGMTVDAQLARRPGDDNRMIIRFILPTDAPPLVDIGTKPAADPPPGLLPADSFSKPPASPTVIGSIDPAAAGRNDTMARASVALQSLGIGAVTIEVAVDGLTGAKFVTPTGSFDGSQNFAVFGTPPVLGAGLDIIAPELFVKPLDTLSVTIKWAGLPITSTGFKGYYQDYILNADGDVAAAAQFDNGSFRASFSVVNPGPWKVDPTAGSQPLFATQPFVLPESAMLASPPPRPAPTPPPAATPRPLPPEPDPAAPLKPEVLLEVPVVAVKDVPPYYNPATSALRLELSDPPYAFGNILYTSNLMAASTALGQANVAGLPNGGANGKQAVGELSRLSRINSDAPEKTYLATIGPAVDAALSAMTGEALVSVNQAIATSGQSAATQEKWRADLNSAMADVTQQGGSLWQRITLRGAAPGRPAAVLANLVVWLDAHEAEFGAGATVPLRQARNTLDAAVQLALAAMLPPAIPNAPWQPSAAGLGINYTASARHLTRPPATTPTDDLVRPNALVMPAVPLRPATTQLPVAPVTGLVFQHIEPFNRTSAPVAAGLTTLLPNVDDNDALYIQLSCPVPQISLLFMLTAGPDGWWSNPPRTDWSQHTEDGWQPVAMVADGTNNLSNSGIITLQLRSAPAGKPVRLRVRALDRTTNAPLVTAVIANALSASWVGPGGASGLGVPLPAKTISKAVTQLTNIGSIYQPMQSFGGRPPASGPAFQMWMAERLRHKGYGITDWDYARIVLENEPSLWQVKVAPAVDGFTGATDAAGKVWVVAVPGAKTPNVVDTTAPLADLTTLSDVGRVIEQCVGPFVEVRVTNPPYLRLKVEIVCDFTADDTVDYWCIKLKKELTLWLSPWPDATIGPRPADYYTRRAIAEFVRNRDYVLGIVELKVGPDTDEVGLGWYYLTSVKADEHIVSAAPMVQRPSSYQPYAPPVTSAPSS
ncbi:MAG: hypothetical protein JWL96_2495 [Sphingomonas bacterium]|uniref:hypothetical protein n=1 Tax=Sphingomonas bacterium TaxID=1895847 RepID=UPI00261C648F|nr:hypothetical protein [Sphingomonas bacterium]MDB5710425.1 hypothetical protein [Sphingomonas bacterium]